MQTTSFHFHWVMTNSVFLIQDNLVCLSLCLFQNSLPFSSEVAQVAQVPRDLLWTECLYLHKIHMLKSNSSVMVLGAFGEVIR